MPEDPLVVPLRALEHWSYCPRQAVLIHGDGVWADNVHILRGLRGHRRVDRAPSRHERGRRVLRSVEVWSERLGLRGRCDVVEVHGDGTLEPVEYKMGVRHGRGADLQVCAQALCLEEMLGVTIEHGAVWFGGTRRRETVVFDVELRTQAIELIETLRASLSKPSLPRAPNDRRCEQCQLLSHCAPMVVARPDRVTEHIEQVVMACD